MIIRGEFMKKQKIFLTCFPLIIGVLIYLFFRSRHLFYFQLLKHLSLDIHIIETRNYIRTFRHLFPNWIIYSLPDGVWLFSFGIALLVNRIYFPLISKIYTIIYIFMIFIEFFQLRFGGHGTFLGTFDLMDIYCFTGGYFLAISISFFFWKKQLKIEFEKQNSFTKLYEIKRSIFIIIIFTFLGFLPSLIKL